MSPLAVHLLRRLALALLVSAAVILGGFRIARELGFLGPGAQTLVTRAAGAVEAARVYGADPSLAPYREAEEALAGARTQLARGEQREARRGAQLALDRAFVAQRMALVRQQELRDRANATAEELSREMDRLEDLYDDVTPGLPKPEVSRLFRDMKKARQAGAALVLARERGDFARVARDEASARRVLASMRAELEAARR